ncbi:type VI secretion system Vgr family protein [Chitinophaga japonensis]|uniref:Rhs element Vgr protein n=1 Tax=Chitinophaga japonensis TaxID=104662 RepID=A0A562T6D6_CHIJA|nr:type VI secretion system Vgr family protein [Chitinophaga japonensis]TWI88646.1 Rhs element Vgr protein [Chitinophaga japonensis]
MALQTRTQITISGKEEIAIKDFHRLQLTQTVNGHHYFELVVDPAGLFGTDSDAVAKTQTLIGQPIYISVEQDFSMKSSSPLLFKGIVTNIATGKRGGIAQAECFIRGYSPTILLDDEPHIEAYEEKSLADIANNLLGQYGRAGLKTSVQPAHNGRLPYIVQYKENTYRFLQRLANRFGEWFYYDGAQLIFGQSSGSSSLLLTYGVDLSSYSLELNTLPSNSRYVGLDYYKDDLVENSTIAHSINGNAYTQHVSKVSESLFAKQATYKINEALGRQSEKEIESIAKLSKKNKVAGMVQLRGYSDNTGLQIGSTVEIKEAFLQDQNRGKYVVTSVTHYCTGNGNYENDFTAIPEEVAAPLVRLDNHPFCEAQSATVVSNNDPEGLGRIRAKFRWQPSGQTPWIRVISAAGGGDKGFFMIPEVGEEVIVDFEGGNPELPFVIGTTYNGKAKSSFGNAGNDVKAIKTRSGNTISLDDASGSITVTDKNGSTMVMDGSGNITVQSQTLVTVKTEDKIVVDAPNKIEFLSKEVHIKGSEKVVIGEGAAQITVDNIANKIESNADKIKSSADTLHELLCTANMKLFAEHCQAQGATKMDISSTSVKVIGDTATDINGGMVNINC